MGELNRFVGPPHFRIERVTSFSFDTKSESLRSRIRLIEEQIATELAKIQQLHDEAARSSATEEQNRRRLHSASQLAPVARLLIEVARNPKEMEQAERLFRRASALEPRADEIDVRHRYCN